MRKKVTIQNLALHNRLRVIANPYRFRILELIQNEQINIRTLSSLLNLSYTKCADYVAILARQGLVKKTKIGKEVFVKSTVGLSSDKIQF